MAVTRIRPARLPALEERRGLIEHAIALRPAVGRVLVMTTMRLPAGALRRALIARFTLGFVAAFNRRDFALVPTMFAPDAEFRPAQPEGVPIGVDFKPAYRGPAGLLEFTEQWVETWGDDFRVHCKEIFDLGDRVLVLNEMHGHARGSTTELRQPEAELLTFAANGHLQLIDQFWTWTEALEAIGLAHAVSRPPPNGHAARR